MVYRGAFTNFLPPFSLVMWSLYCVPALQHVYSLEADALADQKCFLRPLKQISDIHFGATSLFDMRLWSVWAPFKVFSSTHCFHWLIDVLLDYGFVWTWFPFPTASYFFYMVYNLSLSIRDKFTAWLLDVRHISYKGRVHHFPRHWSIYESIRHMLEESM